MHTNAHDGSFREKRGNVIITRAMQISSAELGISGELLHTPGHSADSISLWLDEERAVFVGDLNPLYELELHRGTQIAQSWEKLLALHPKRICYGHARTAVL